MGHQPFLLGQMKEAESLLWGEGVKGQGSGELEEGGVPVRPQATSGVSKDLWHAAPHSQALEARPPLSLDVVPRVWSAGDHRALHAPRPLHPDGLVPAEGPCPYIG